MRLRLGGVGDAFADRNFRIYSIGSVLSWLSFYVQMVAISWTAWELTHSTTWLAIIAVLDIAPNLIFLPLGGVLADRIDRFRMVLTAYAAAWLHVVVLTILAYAGALTITPLAALAFAHGLIHSFSVPAAYGMMPRFIARERLSSAIAVNSAYTQFAILRDQRWPAGSSCIMASPRHSPPMSSAISSFLLRSPFCARRRATSSRRPAGVRCSATLPTAPATSLAIAASRRCFC
jgi:MFS family permease